MEEKKKTIIYTSLNCSFCILLKEFFKERGVEYEEIDVSQNIEEAQKMKEETGQLGVPVIKTPEGEIIIGFNQEELEKIYG